jgi:hypothetical protein
MKVFFPYHEGEAQEAAILMEFLSERLLFNKM